MRSLLLVFVGAGGVNFIVSPTREIDQGRSALRRSDRCASPLARRGTGRRAGRSVARAERSDP